MRFPSLSPLACAVALAVMPAAGGAQIVGHPPERSPFRDLDYRQEITLFGGYFRAGRDPAGAAPRSGPTLGARYEIGVGGPAGIFARTSYVRSERMVIDPNEPAATRERGLQDWPLYIADVGLALNLTGRRSWHNVVPVITGGFGLASDGTRTVEEDPYRFGTTFAFTYGASLRVVPPGRFQVRLGLDNYAYRLRYPAQYYEEAEDGTAVVDRGQARGFWKTNRTFTIGGSYLFFR